uniref:Pre-16S rRNA nuclease isoform X3 n=1 Tax=Elaeis guineensis var. tenera TaxID=51953 RepID=A0A6I9QC92_ELAGV|nr:putative pre-16S rRNA nuclease isoform X3 [Elaeis guineensis]
MRILKGFGARLLSAQLGRVPNFSDFFVLSPHFAEGPPVADCRRWSRVSNLDPPTLPRLPPPPPIFAQMKLVKPIELFQKFLKSGSMEKGRLLGLDVGQKYVGLAVSDTCNKIASPLSVLVRKKTNIDLVARDLQTLVSQLSLVGFVVGYPFSLQGQSSIEAVQVKLFVEDLRKTGRLDGSYFTYWNENYTSKCVQALLDPLKLHPVESKTIIDKFAAVGILQGYLDDMNRNLKSEDMPKE